MKLSIKHAVIINLCLSFLIVSAQAKKLRIGVLVPKMEAITGIERRNDKRLEILLKKTTAEEWETLFEHNSPVYVNVHKQKEGESFESFAKTHIAKRLDFPPAFEFDLYFFTPRKEGPLDNLSLSLEIKRNIDEQFQLRPHTKRMKVLILPRFRIQIPKESTYGELAGATWSEPFHAKLWQVEKKLPYLVNSPMGRLTQQELELCAKKFHLYLKNRLFVQNYKRAWQDWAINSLENSFKDKNFLIAEYFLGLLPVYQAGYSQPIKHPLKQQQSEEKKSR